MHRHITTPHSIAAAMLMLAATAHAQQQTTIYHLSTGTGFVINGDGYIVTNDHVVRGCQSISILTPRGEEKAELVGNDAQRDLAVLKTDYNPAYHAYLRSNLDTLGIGDGVSIIGYPGQAGAFGREQTKKTRILGFSHPEDSTTRWMEEKNARDWLELLPVAAHGNSGGPVIDDSGNVIGVVSGIAYTYKADVNGQPTGDVVSRKDVAITAPDLQDFLQAHAVRFDTSPSDDRGLNDSTLHSKVQRFIVPVRCVVDTVTQ